MSNENSTGGAGNAGMETKDRGGGSVDGSTDGG